MLVLVRRVVSIRARSVLSLRSAAIVSTDRPVSSFRRLANAARRVWLRATRIRSLPRLARRAAEIAPVPEEAPGTGAGPLGFLGLLFSLLGLPGGSGPCVWGSRPAVVGR